MENKLLYKIHVSGHVQGVGFRWSSASEARKRGLTGYVKNLTDGRVYIEAEGPCDELNSFVAWCKKGPVLCIVDSVSVDISTPHNYADFDIR